MAHFFSASTKGFYHAQVHGSAMPPDAVEISDELHQQILHKQGNGKVIQADAKGMPVAVPFVPSPEQVKRELPRQASAALTASDSIVLEHYEEGSPVPAEWVAYRKQLRAVVAGELAEMPEAPVVKGDGNAG
jgi:hypothetical protein